MFLKSAKVLLFLRAQTLDVYVKGSEEAGEISFTPGVIKHLEVVNPAKLNELIISFIARSGLDSQDAVLLLSDEVTFHKKFNRDTPDAEEELIETFFDKVPLDKSHQARQVIVLEDALFASATNKNLYETIINSLLSNDWKINTVTPGLVFGELPSKLDPQLVDDILNAGELLDKYNLLNEENLEHDPKDEKNEDGTEASKAAPSRRGFWLVLLLILILLLSSGAYAAYKFGYLRKLVNRINPGVSQNNSSSESSQSAIPLDLPAALESSKAAESTGSGAISTAERESLTIQVLNGSGIGGQAAKARDQLTTLGYKNFELGNADLLVDDATVFLYVSGTKPEIVTEIKNSLGTIFLDVNVSEATESSQFDVQIITGQ